MNTEQFEVKNRYTGEDQFTAKITTALDMLQSVKLGLAVRLAQQSDANLRDANLRGANLRDADLCGASLCGADLRDAEIKATQRETIIDSIGLIIEK